MAIWPTTNTERDCTEQLKTGSDLLEVKKVEDISLLKCIFLIKAIMSNGLSNGWTIKRIDSVFTDPNGDIFYYIQFKGQTKLEKMPAEKIMRIVPDMVIDFYMDRLSSCPKSKTTRKRKAEEE
ncbi:uncharacterized protein LOC119551432 [Drosophila subpulchrella]|uniref:uncharacterized protein LOC119551432 n=1 Tax=Drosophila subpulchrella TaxID=1486046 RepID=UPI0018A13709|nr:uncharacterized protein LOC119551432 [Drosophila subpulchrella]